MAEAKPGQSYSWTVVLEPSDIRFDPQGICLVREHEPEEPSVVQAVEPRFAPPPDITPVEPVMAPVAAVAEPVGSEENKSLVKRLTNLGMHARVARELVQQHPADLIEAAIGRAKARKDLKSRPAFIVCDIRDGGYDDNQMLRSEAGGGTTGQPVSDAPRTYSSAEQTRADMQAMEAENATKQQQFNETMKSLQARCAELSQTLKDQLKECCERAIDSLVPQTSGREAQLENSSYKKLAFKNVMERFFALMDQGTKPEEAVRLLAAV